MNPTEKISPSGERVFHRAPDEFRWQALAGVALGVFMFTLDGSIVNIAIPTFIRVFHATLPGVRWIVLSYLIVIAGFLLPVARVAPYLGQKKVFLIGLALFTAGSLLCGTAWSLPSLVGFRVIQGLGAIGMAALMSSLILAAVPPGKVGQSLGIVTTFATLGTSLGPTIGGYLISWFGWRSLFLMNLPAGLAAVFLVARFIPRDLPLPGPVSLRALVPDFSVFLNPIFRVGLAGRFVSMGINGGYLFLAPILLENALHYSTEHAGLLLATTPVVAGITAPIFGSLSDRFGILRFNLAGLTFMLLALFAMGGFTAGMSGGEFALRVCLWGLGLGIFNAPNNICVMRCVPKAQAGTASAMLSLSIMLGQAVGVAALSAAFYYTTSARAAGGIANLPAPTIASGVSGALFLAAIPIVALLGMNFLAGPRIRELASEGEAACEPA